MLAPLEDENEDDTAIPHANGTEPHPLVIAETKVAVRTMPVAMAVMQLDLSDNPALLFRNAAHGGLNLVYRRPDGNVGWIDPERAAAQAS
ncbi:MAG: sigma 54 modulation/S30EA ribosomal C-terminal domain-containing protein [Terricaulis sp.]